MTFWQRIKQGFRNFMMGRHGADQLSMALVWTGLIVYILSMVTGWGILSLVSMGLYIYSIYRIKSRNKQKRSEENRKYMGLANQGKTQFTQAKARFKNRKQYKYFKCPQCHAWLRLPHGAGDVSVTCGRCKNEFQKKA